MKRSYKIFWIIVILLIPVFPLSGLLYGVDISDVGLSINQYRFCFEDMDSVYLPILLSELIGGVWFKICGILRIPTYFGVEVLWVLTCYYLCFISYRTYQKYKNDNLILPALAVAMLFAKTNFHYFIYTTGVAVMALTGLFFLVKALNEKKPVYLALTSFFLVMACLCKISSMLQFAVFAVLFYDFYKKRDKTYLIKQLVCCVIGFVAGLLAAALLVGVTCGIDAYMDMIAEMFLYAGNSEDGHTLGNMIMSNAMGTLRGLLLLAVLELIYFISKKLKKSSMIFLYGIPAAIVLLIIGKIAGADGISGFSSLYGILFGFINALAVAVALIYVCAILILRDQEYSQEFKNLALSAGILTVLMPIGSNTGIQHICNEIYFVMPFIAIYIGDRVRRFFASAQRRIKSSETAKMSGWFVWKAPSVGVMLTVITAVWCIGLAAYQSLYLTRAYHTAEKEIKAYSLEELKFMHYEADMVDEIEKTARFLKQYKDQGRKLLVAGDAPIFNYLSGMPPFNAGCGGWIETEFITSEKMETQLKELTVYPIVLVSKAAAEEGKPKIRLVTDFVDENPYEQVFESEKYLVYLPIEG